MRRSPTFAAVVILALAALEIAVIVASLRGWDALALTRFDYASSAVSIPLGIAAGVGLLRWRRWGWTLALVGVAFGFVCEVGALPFGDEPWPLAIQSLGMLLLLTGALLAVLNGHGVRAHLVPPPSGTGLLADLPVEPCLAGGLVLIVGGLAVEVGWGWMILALTLAVVLARRLRRRARSTI